MAASDRPARPFPDQDYKTSTSYSQSEINSILQVRLSISTAAVLRRILQLFHTHSHPVFFQVRSRVLRVPLGPEPKSSFKICKGSIHNHRSNKFGTRWSCVGSIIRNSTLIDSLVLIQSPCPLRVQQLRHCQVRPYPNYQVHRSAKPRMGNTYSCILIILHLRLQRFPGQYLCPTVSSMGKKR